MESIKARSPVHQYLSRLSGWTPIALLEKVKLGLPHSLKSFGEAGEEDDFPV